MVMPGPLPPLMPPPPTPTPTPTSTPTPTVPPGPRQGWWNEPQTLVPSAEGVFALPGTDPAQAAIEAVAPMGGEGPEGKMGFEDWKISVGMETAWLTGGAAIQKDIWNAYQEYLTGVAGAGADEGTAAPLFSPEEERMLTDLQNAVEVGQMDEEQAWDVVENYWSGQAVETRKAEEAGRRGEAEVDYWKNIYRSVGPTPTLPRPEGLGFGVPPLEGTPVSQLPQPGEIFGQAQTQMGLPETLGPISPPNIQLPNWQQLGQAMPQFGGRNYFEELLREGRSTGF